MEILKVQNLCKTYGKGDTKVDALKNVSFSLEKGEFAAVVGESGSGKSTLLNCIGALDTPTSGSIMVDRQDLFSMKEEQRTIFRRRNIGFIFQSFQLISELNVEQNIIFPLLLDYRQPNLLTQASRHYQQTILMITHNKNLTSSVDRVFRVTDGTLTDLGGKADETLS